MYSILSGVISKPKKLNPSIIVGITVGTFKNTGATCVNIIIPSSTNIITLLLRAAHGD